jgi:hypothetical protein
MPSCRMTFRKRGTGKSTGRASEQSRAVVASQDALIARDSRFDDESRNRLSAEHAIPRLEDRDARRHHTLSATRSFSWMVLFSSGIRSPSFLRPSRWQRIASRAISHASAKVLPYVIKPGSRGTVTWNPEGSCLVLWPFLRPFPVAANPDPTGSNTTVKL